MVEKTAGRIIMSGSYLLAFLFAAFVVRNGESLELKFQCPLEDVPDPCECFEMFGNVFFRCSNVENVEQLESSIRQMSGYGMTKFEMSNSELLHLPHDLFTNTSLMRMELKNTAMTNLFSKPVQGCSNLNEIYLDTVTFQGGLDWSVLESLPQLSVLSATKCNLQEIPQRLSMPVETLLLPYNGIESLHPLVFSQLSKLKNLQLGHNLIERMQRSMLPHPITRINFLDLSHNRLSSLPDDMFEGMPELNSLILRGNSFFVLEKSYMNTVFSSLMFFDVNDNPLKCGCELSWVLSENRPYHFFGLCSLEEESNRKDLKDLLPDDFNKC